MLMCVMDKYNKKSMCGKWIYIYACLTDEGNAYII